MSSTRGILNDQHEALIAGWRGKLRRLESAWPPASVPRLTYRSARIDCRVLLSEWRASSGIMRACQPELRPPLPNARIFAVIPAGAWETHNLVPALRAFGAWDVFDPTPPRGVTDKVWLDEQRASTNAALRGAFEVASEKAPVQLVFGYVSNWMVEAGSIEFMRDAGAFTFGFSLDDRLSFSGS